MRSRMYLLTLSAAGGSRLAMTMTVSPASQYMLSVAFMPGAPPPWPTTRLPSTRSSRKDHNQLVFNPEEQKNYQRHEYRPDQIDGADFGGSAFTGMYD